MQEYADSLQNSGIHGAVMVLDPTFSADTMAKALDIPSNKHMIHRHLYEEMKVLLNPARCAKLHFSIVMGNIFSRLINKDIFLVAQSDRYHISRTYLPFVIFLSAFGMQCMSD